MKISPETQDIIKNAFKAMENKTDFLALLNLAKTEIYGDKAMPFSEKQLNFYITKDLKKIKQKIDFQVSLSEDKVTIKDNVTVEKDNVRKSCYTSFTIKKKSGGERTLHAPVKGLKEFQKALNFILQCLHQPHAAATGFVLGKSIVDNASKHINQNYVYNLDLKDFFPSIDKSRVWGRLLVEPFNLGSSAERKTLANVMATLCCTPMQVERLVNNEWTKITTSVLPQGAPTSPTLTNAICDKLDKRLSGVAKRFGLNYSRYADDITFSSMHNSFEVEKGKFENIYTKDGSFDQEVRRIIAEQNFTVKESKVRLQKRGYRQEVTGVVVNDKANVNRKYINELRKNLYLWETYGYEKAYTIFLKTYSADKGHIKKSKPNMMCVLEGKLLYLKMVKGENDGTYLKFKNKFDGLIGGVSPDISKVLDVWKHEGIESAMGMFYAKNDSNQTKQETSSEHDFIL